MATLLGIVKGAVDTVQSAGVPPQTTTKGNGTQKTPPAGGTQAKAAGSPSKDKLQQEIVALKAEAVAVEQEDRNAKLAFWSKLNQGNREAAAVLQALLYEIGAAYFKKESSQGGAFGDLNSTANLLEMLSDKKAIMTNGSLPGTYRYYSASHPQPEHQGQQIVNLDLRQKMKTKSLNTQNPYIDTNVPLTPIATFVPSEGKTWVEGAKEPECSIQPGIPQWGIKVFTNAVAGGEIIPTSEVRELMFAVHEVTSDNPKNDTKKVLDVPGLGTAKMQEYQDGAVAMVQSKSGSYATATVNSMFAEWRTSIKGELAEAVQVARNASINGPVISDFPFPEATPLVYRNATIPRDVVLGSGVYTFKDVSGSKELFPGSSAMTLAMVWEELAKVEAKTLYNQVMGVQLGVWFTSVQEGLGETEASDATSILTNFLFVQAGEDAPKQQKKIRGKAVSVRTIESPVFPVSDAKGYEVVGTFRYGRDIDIDPQGVFAELHNTDIFAILNKTTLDNVVRALVKGEAITIQTQIGTTSTGKPIYGPTTVSGARAATEIEKAVLRDLRARMTDDQIINLGIAAKGKDPNMLEMRFMNWFAEQGKDGVQKIQLSNVGYSLADISMNNSKAICSCKAAEADVFLEAAGQDNFVQYVQPGVLAPAAVNPETLDRPTQWSISIAAQASMGWKMSQDALRGMIPGDKPSSIVESTLALSNISDSIKANTSEARGQLTQALQRLEEET